MTLNQFIGRNQLQVMKQNCKGEEGQFFKDLFLKLNETIRNMPKTYETDGQGNEAIATLHYFNGGSDWYIVEKDAGSVDDEVPGIQAQAFGFTCLNGDGENAELGYISIEALIKHNVEIDLYYKPEKIGDIKARFRL